MHSFAQSHSFLLAAILFCLVSPSRIFGVAAIQASEVYPLNHSEHAVPPLHNGRRRKHSELSGALAVSHGTDMMPDPGRRAAGASFTHFKTGLGACGHFNVATDFIVAISKLHYDGGTHCGETITITAKGKTAQATIMDKCMGCAFNDIDLTVGLYQFFDPTMFGVFTGDWEFGSGGAAAKPPPTSSKKPAPPPPTTTSSKVHTTTSSKSSVQPTSSKASASTTSQNSSSSAVASATASTSPIAPAGGNLGNLFDALVNLGGLIVQTVPSSS